jgi:hypothetical protein
MPFPAEGLAVKDWWFSIRNDTSVTIIVAMAVFLYSLACCAAVTERSFSIMKWYNSPHKNQQSVAAIKMLSMVKTGLNALQQPR